MSNNNQIQLPPPGLIITVNLIDDKPFIRQNIYNENKQIVLRNSEAVRFLVQWNPNGTLIIERWQMNMIELPGQPKGNFTFAQSNTVKGDCVESIETQLL